MNRPPGYVVRIERTFDAPAEAVFDAWTRPEVMRRWWHAGPDWETPEPRSISGWAERFES
jgi:uncharacterized protein YndB with AHSA1/START domain